MKSLKKLMSLALLGLAVATLSACGSSGGSTDTAAAPEDPNEPATGKLRVFAYAAAVTPEMMNPFKKQNPDLDVDVATFDSNSEAASKIAAGFKTDLVQVCLDEADPLIKKKQLRPIDTEGVTAWDKLAFHDNDGVRVNGDVIVVPISAGPIGVIYNTEEVNRKIDSYADIFDPEFSGKSAIDGTYPLPPIAMSALASGVEDPFSMSEEELAGVADYMDEHRDQLRALWASDADLKNLHKSGEVVISDGNQGVAKQMADEGIPVEWVAPKEGTLSWVCGWSITADAENIPAAYRMINWQSSPQAEAIQGNNGYVVTNPGALPLVDPANREIADPSSLADAIPETYPPNYDQWTKTFEAFRAG